MYATNKCLGVFHIFPKVKVKSNASLVVMWALAHRLQYRTTCIIQNGHQSAPKWLTGSERRCNHRLLAAPVNFRKK